MSRYLVTGSTGFLGRHLITALRAHGHEMVVLVRTANADQTFPSGVTRTQGDILDKASVERAADGCEGVFHCAGNVSRRPEDAEMLQRVHVEGTKNVLDACMVQNVRRAVIASTSGTVAVSDDPHAIATEDSEAPLGIVNRFPYYRSKLFAEKAAFERQGAALPGGGTFEVLSVNPALLLGPGDIYGSSTEDVRLFLERKIPITPPGGISFVDARDAAEGMRLAMAHGRPGRRYLLGACNLTLHEFFARLERISGVRAPRFTLPQVFGRSAAMAEFTRAGVHSLEQLATRVGIAMPVDPVSIDMAFFYWYLDASRAENELGWVSRDPLVTLSDTVKDLVQRGVVWPGLDTSAGSFAENEPS